MMKDFGIQQNPPVVYASAAAPVPTHTMTQNAGIPNQQQQQQTAQYTNALPDRFNEGGAVEFMSEQKWPKGIQETFVNNLNTIAFRYFICDDSGSMSMCDGNQVIGGPSDMLKR